jgi:alginate O-acetyltransferase complex protein AlgI
MLFNTSTFAVFFIIVLSLYWILRRSYRSQNLLLLVASYIFYGWWDIRFLFLILVSTVVDYCSSLFINHGRMTASERLKASGFLLFSALFFSTPDWTALRLSLANAFPFVTVNCNGLWPDTVSGYRILIVSLAAVIVFNLAALFAARLNIDFRKKLFLFFSVLINLSILGFFKYFNFFAESLVSMTQTLFHYTPPFVTLHIVLPVGISFFTFQTMSHTIDVYRKKISATSSLTNLAAYVSFFPQLVAGPIERGAHLLPQFQRARSINSMDVRESIWLITWGLYKKIVVADTLAKIVNTTFAPFSDLTQALAVPEDGIRLLVAVYAFTIQIYCDFSGYSDIARGTAKLLGFDIMLNFNLPYFAKSPSDFWRRWHISLSTWLRDYLYISLGGNRNGTIKLYRNLMITMLLGGLWHGAAWTFVIWGGFHGIILILYRILAGDLDQKKLSWLSSGLLGLIMFHLVCLGWLIFRAQNLTVVTVFLNSIFLHPHWSVEAADCFKNLIFCSWFLIAFQIIQKITGTLNPMAKWPWFVRLNVWIILIMSLLSLSAKTGQEFIYFAF